MKKGILIHSEISYAISKLGHGDDIVIADSGLPIPNKVQRIDLALAEGIPSFMQVLNVVLSEQRVEEVIIAQEVKERNPKVYEQLLETVCNYEKTEQIKLKITEVSHEVFKMETQKAKAIIRTGEYTPYANIILRSGVVF
ncbi:D-ribose pyranase [Cellulosilyticum sp. I15G10I2]|uniref:D-ribose pyranase n=1 Tax=Cellulosilyticum sp. I15G10I2 TaxID=1892843 RepID=UPI00085C30F7|nr:D-ribose pyranase [Cellulosilyticum sp. I15G10I2]